MRMVRIAVIPVTVGLLLSCDGSERFTGPLTSESCSSGGRTHSGSVPSGTWRRAASPHVLVDSVVVDSALTIEPGALVCGMPGSALTVPALKAVGTEDSPIVFTSDDPDGWGGLRGAGVLRNARIERTITAIRGPFEIDRSTILRTRSWAVNPVRGELILRDVVIDSACTAGGCGAVLVQPFGRATLEDVVIRWSGGDGISAGPEFCGLMIDGGRIEGSAGVGIRVVLQKPFRACGFTLLEPIRITGGASHPAVVHADAAVHLLRSPESQAALTGNALDTLVVIGEYDFADASLTLTRTLPVRIGLSCGYYRSSEAELGTITLEPGASLALGACEWSAHLRASGTASEPVTVRGAPVGRLHMAPGHADTAHLRHVVFRDHVVLRADSAPAILEDIALYDSSLELFAAGSRIDGIDAVRSNGLTRFSPGHPDPRPTLVLRSGTRLRNARIAESLADGVVVNGDDVSIERCTITASAQHGIHVLAGGPVVRSCSIVGNEGNGVRNAGSGQVDARLNWWGDALGPLGPNGDGVHGDILYDPFLATRDSTAG